MRILSKILSVLWLPIIILEYGYFQAKYAIDSINVASYLAEGSRVDIIVITIGKIINSYMFIMMTVIYAMILSVKHEKINFKIKYKSNFSRILLEAKNYSIITFVYTFLIITIFVLYARYNIKQDINWSSLNSYYAFKTMSTSDVLFINIVIKLFLILYVNFEMIYILYNIIYHLIHMKVVSIMIEFIFINVSKYLLHVNILASYKYDSIANNTNFIFILLYCLMIIVGFVALKYVVNREEYDENKT